MLSFKSVLNAKACRHNHGKEVEDDDTFLFTKLMRQKADVRRMEKTPHQFGYTIEDQGKERRDLHFWQKRAQQCEAEFEMLKLEKANRIADTHLAHGLSLKELIELTSKELKREIRQILLRFPSKSNSMHSSKQQKLLSTLGSPGDEKVVQSGSRFSSLKPSSQPKIIQFTLGNQGSSRHTTYEHKFADVSQFEVGRSCPVSKHIKEKVMGHNKKLP